MVEVVGLDELMKEHHFFDGFDKKALELMAGCARNETFRAGEYIFKSSSDATHFYIIRHGNVSVELPVPGRGRITLQTVGEHETLGWSWLVPPYRWSADAKTISLVRAISLDAVCLRTKMEEDHELGYRIMQRFVPVLAERLHSATVQLLDLYGLPEDRGR